MREKRKHIYLFRVNSVLYYKKQINVEGGILMAIKCKLSVLMGKEKYRIQDVHLKTGLSRATVSNLYHDRMERIDYSTLGKLCELFKCNVGELLEFYDKD